MSSTENAVTDTSSVPMPQTDSEQGRHKGPSNLTQRVITSLTLLPLVLALTWFGGVAYLLLAGGIGALGLLEFYNLARGRDVIINPIPGLLAYALVVLAYFLGLDTLPSLALAVVAIILTVAILARRLGRSINPWLGIGGVMIVAGVVYLGFPVGFLVSVRGMTDGLMWTFVIFALTWGTDTFAYIGGRLWGRHKLAPQISPKKTTEGAIVGWSAGFTAAMIVLAVNQQLSPLTIALCAIGPIAAILGDLVESLMKRAFNVKDSHLRGLDIFPGHGGVLDRTDSLIVVATLCYGYVRLLGLG